MTEPAMSPREALDSVARVRLAALPTPLEDAPRLATHLGLSKLLIKRDDLTGLGFGGNKARKLEYEFAELTRLGCDVVLTIGGPQSNHAVMTAAAARRLGIDVKIVLGGPDFSRFSGNLLLDVLLGVEIRYLRDDDRDEVLASAMEEWAGELRAQGRRPYTLPIGGSTGLGAIGYVRAMQELADQAGPGPLQIVLAAGSCGTLAGTILGAQMFLPSSRVIGVSVSRTSRAITQRTLNIMTECRRILGFRQERKAASVESYDTYYKEYGLITESGKDAILTAAKVDGILLDPVYTGKAMAGLMDLARKRILDPMIPVVFIHTGGLPILFSMEDEFSAHADCSKL